MTDTTVNAGLVYTLLRKENFILFSALVVLLLSYLGLMGFYSHGALAATCCGAAFWWSPLGCAVVLVGSSLLLRFRRAVVYPAIVLMSIFTLSFSSYVALQRWIDYSQFNKGYALQQALLPLYRPLSILLSVYILSLATKRLVNFLKCWLQR